MKSRNQLNIKMFNTRFLTALFFLSFLFVSLFSQFNYQVPANYGVSGNPRSEQSEVRNISKIMVKVKKSVSSFPIGANRVAIYKITADRNAISPGMVKFIKGKLEETIMQETNIELVAIPEFNITKIKITDSTFSFVNAARNYPELKAVAEKYNVDAFIQGFVTRGIHGDILFTLKMMNSKTGSVIWSKSFIEGPNRDDDIVNPIKFRFFAGYKVHRVQDYVSDGTSMLVNASGIKYSGASVDLSEFSFGFIREQRAAFKEIDFWLLGGMSFFAMEEKYPSEALGFDQVAFNELPNITTFFGGVGFSGRIIEKKRRNLEDLNVGYWLNPYAMARFYIPTNYSTEFLAFDVGINTEATSNIYIGFGVGFVPQTKIVGQATNDYIDFEAINYEVHLTYNF